MKPLDKEDTEHIDFRKLPKMSYFPFFGEDGGETQHSGHHWCYSRSSVCGPICCSQPLPFLQ